MARLSRRSIAEYIATSLVAGKPSKKQLFTELAAFLVDEGRTGELGLIVRDIEYYLSKNGVVQTTVTSAYELTAATKKEIETFVKNETQANDVHVTNIVDPSVLGGVKISIPGRELDQTVARTLTVLKTGFKKV